MFSSNTSSSGVTPDAQFNYVTMLLHGNGTNGAQNNTFLDSSTNNFTITRNGNTTQGTFTPYGDNWGNYFDGSGDWLNVASNAAFGYGTGDFTIEFWVFPTSATGTQVYLDQRAGSATSAAPTIYTISGTIYYYVSGSNRITGGTVTTNQWSHIALCRSGTSTKLFINGVQTGSTYTDSTTYVTAPVRIGDGNDGAGPYPYPGYVSNFRIVKGTALYTAAFTPPTTPLTAITNTSLLTCQSNRFIDNSSNAFTITRNGDVSVQRFSPFNPTAPYSAATIGGSGYFDGTGDYLTIADTAALELGSSDFCIEVWFYQQATTSRSIFNKRADAGSYGLTVFAQNASQTCSAYISSNGSSWDICNNAAMGTLISNAWNHVALYRSGNNWYGAINGTPTLVSTSSSGVVNNTAAWNFGAETDGYGITGYLSSGRIVIGSAVYGASAFTPPTTPLTAITNTSLLLNFTNGGIIDNAMMNDLETLGNAQISTSVSKFGTGSISFPGSSWLYSKNTSNIIGSGDFTIEMFVRFTDTNRAGVIEFWSSNSWLEWSINAGVWPISRLVLAIGGGYVITSNTSLSTGTFHHVAIVRNGTTLTLYQNGTSVGSTTDSTNLLGPGEIQVGTALAQPMNGYIDDLRITKGYARYTANFTPPSAPFPDQ